MFDDSSKKGAVIESVDGGYIVTVVASVASHPIFGGPAEEAKKIFPKFRDAFDFLAFHLAPGENDADTLEGMEKELGIDPLRDPDEPYPGDRDSLGD